MKTYRIGVDARPLSTPMSGVGRLIHETLKSFPHKEDYEFYLYSHTPIHEHHESVLKLKNIKWYKGDSFFSKKGGLYFSFELPFQLRNHNLDLFWGTQQVLPPLLPKNMIAILSYMDLVLYLYPETMRPIARIQQRLFQKYSVNRADFIISISENTNIDMQKKFQYPSKKTDVAYPGIDPISIQEALESSHNSSFMDTVKQPYILSVSTIEPRKNYRFLLRVFRSIRETKLYPDLKWVIAGKRGWETAEFYNELDHDIKKYGDIIVKEGLLDSELHNLYKNSSLFWMGSLYEGFGIPVVEAFYHKKMAILSGIRTFREIGKDSIEYLGTMNENDVLKWKELTIKYLNEKTKFNGDISEFTWENSAKKIESIFRKKLKRIITK